MKPHDAGESASDAPAPAPGENTLGSGEGSKSALEALIRKRKETPDEPEAAPPAPPA